MKAKKFKKTVFVGWCFDGDDPYQVINDKAEDFAELGETVVVAEYKLVATHVVKDEPTVTRINTSGR